MPVEPDRDPATSRRTPGPTPAGGAYAVGYFRDAAGEPCPEAEAVAVEIVEFAADGTELARTYADLGPVGPGDELP